MLSGEASEFLDRAVMRLPLKDELHVDIAGEAEENNATALVD